MEDFKYSLIAAIGKGNNVIGLDNSIPWDIPLDMKYFKEVTTNNVVIMGRKTYESIGKTLPNRINIVITRNQNKLPIEYRGLIVKNFEDALKIASSFKDKETFVIGGGEIYNEAIKTAHKLYLTWVSRKDGDEIEGNRYFPVFNMGDFRLVDELTYENNQEFTLEFNTFIRENNK